ncbi:FAD-binding protein [Microcoleus sp. PH2017_31_RDM_U_A]|uniref:FAD-binding protein n=1 Tax=Microcoleus sp. PH2017_31_RDM_U_A TaxID=2798841 RepID=UPI0025F55960|nr:FAD-binding protein [Microcoleus sp. PH2017_31_RDM_U_A]
MLNQHYDVIIIGTGAGGGTLAHHLAPSGKKILILERGTFLPREKENWSALEVYQRERYHTQRYERLNMPVIETSIDKAWGFLTYFFHTLIKQRRKSYSEDTEIRRMR